MTMYMNAHEKTKCRPLQPITDGLCMTQVELYCSLQGLNDLPVRHS